MDRCSLGILELCKITPKNPQSQLSWALWTRCPPSNANAKSRLLLPHIFPLHNNPLGTCRFRQFHARCTPKTKISPLTYYFFREPADRQPATLGNAASNGRILPNVSMAEARRPLPMGRLTKLISDCSPLKMGGIPLWLLRKTKWAILRRRKIPCWPSSSSSNLLPDTAAGFVVFIYIHLSSGRKLGHRS